MRDYLWGSAPNLKRGIVYGALPQTPPARFSFGEKRGKRTYISFFTLSFRAGVYGTKTGMDLRKIYCLFRLLDRKNWGGSQPQSVGKIKFYRNVSHSLRSSDTLRLFYFYFWNFSLVCVVEFMPHKRTWFRERLNLLF